MDKLFCECGMELVEGKCSSVDCDKEPKDLEIRIGTKRGAEIDKLIRMQEESILKQSLNIDIDKAVLVYLKSEMKKEEEILESQKNS